jgi:hypothetical protein
MNFPPEPSNGEEKEYYQILKKFVENSQEQKINLHSLNSFQRKK